MCSYKKECISHFFTKSANSMSEWRQNATNITLRQSFIVSVLKEATIWRICSNQSKSLTIYSISNCMYIRRACGIYSFVLCRRHFGNKFEGLSCHQLRWQYSKYGRNNDSVTIMNIIIINRSVASTDKQWSWN